MPAENDLSSIDCSELAAKLRELGTIRVLDLHQAAFARGILNPWVHDGWYYILPPEGVPAKQVEALLNEYKALDVIHFEFNAQSSIDIPHKPILPLDAFADKYFGKPKDGMVKVTAVSRQKVAELNALIDDLKRPFDAELCPEIHSGRLAGYKPPQEGRQTVLAVVVPDGNWKDLTRLEEGLKRYLAESNLSREILANRHSVRGMASEVVLSTTDEATDKGNQFLSDAAKFLEGLGPVEGSELPGSTAISGAEAVAPIPTTIPDVPSHHPDPEQLYRQALRALVKVLSDSSSYKNLQLSVSGNMVLVEFAGKGFLSLGTFGREHLDELQTAYLDLKAKPELAHGWSAHYRYDKDFRILSIRVGPETERAPNGWTPLY